jgi:hypothetical protein
VLHRKWREIATFLPLVAGQFCLVSSDYVSLDQQSDVVIVFWAILRLESGELDTEPLPL